MPLTIAELMDDVTLENQQYFDFQNGTGDEVQLLTVWLNDTQRDLLHNGVWRHLLRATTSVTTNENTRIYALTPHDIRRVEGVFDETAQAFLSPFENVFPPSSTASPEDKPRTARPATDLAIFRADTIFPGFYWILTTVADHVQTHTLHLFGVPLANNTGTMTVYYTKQAPNIASATDNANLVIDYDGRDALKAGILWRMFMYHDQPAKAERWKAVYDAAKTGEAV